jgi:hypothetical protein
MVLHPSVLAAWFLLATTSCASAPENPSFPVTVPAACAALREMEAAPKPLARPVVVLGGYHDPGFGPMWWAAEVRRWARRPRVIGVQFARARDFEECRRDVIAAVDRAFPTADPEATVEVDVIGPSMGGLVARHAALPRPGERRLKVARLFTISTPHRGAALASLPALSRLHADMRTGSAFLRRLDEADALAAAGAGDAGDGRGRYELVPYTRLGDRIVGPANAAPAGAAPWWVANVPLQPAHVGANLDPRIRADIARRLRGEPPFTRSPAAPLPGEG